MPKRFVDNISLETKFAGKISNAAQIGGIETSVIDNGYARGVRIAWINTGCGLRYKIVIDRAMDIADAFHNQHSIAWLSSLGVYPPSPFSDKGIDWLRTFGGGLLTTCGLTHVGGNEKDEYGERGLHGLISNIPAEIVSIIQPDPIRGKMDMSITGLIKETRPFGPSLELRRTISSTLGQPFLKIHDEVTNTGNTTAPHMLLYHMNFGWPLVDEGTELVWNGRMGLMNEQRDKAIFNGNNNYKICPAPLEAHRGTGEAAAYFDIEKNSNGECVCGLYNRNISMAVSLTFKKEQLPWLTNWQHWGPGEYVTGIEPGTHPPIGQARARKENSLIQIEPGETKYYHLRLDVLDDEQRINDFLRNK